MPGRLRRQRKQNPDRQSATSASVQAPTICLPISPTASRRCTCSASRKNPAPTWGVSAGAVALEGGQGLPKITIQLPGEKLAQPGSLTLALLVRTYLANQLIGDVEAEAVRTASVARRVIWCVVT